MLSYSTNMAYSANVEHLIFQCLILHKFYVLPPSGNFTLGMKDDGDGGGE